jgi:two-component system, OmpR family, response regulator RegX3
MPQPLEHNLRLLLVRDTRSDSGSLLRVQVFDDWEAASEQIWARAPDLLLIESSDTHAPAAAFCRRLRPFFQLPILVVESGASERDRMLLLDSGADDVVACTSGLAELLARFNALRRRLQRQERLDPQLHYLRVATLALDITGRRLLLEGRQLDLSLSLIKLLSILIQHHDGFVSRELLAEHVFGASTSAAQARISALVNLLRRRIEGELGLPPLVVGVMGRGYRLNHPAPTP